jgi:hypothetical protein
MRQQKVVSLNLHQFQSLLFAILEGKIKHGKADDYDRWIGYDPGYLWNFRQRKNPNECKDSQFDNLRAPEHNFLHECLFIPFLDPPLKTPSKIPFWIDSSAPSQPSQLPAKYIFEQPELDQPHGQRVDIWGAAQTHQEYQHLGHAEGQKDQHWKGVEHVRAAVFFAGVQQGSLVSLYFLLDLVAALELRVEDAFYRRGTHQ